MRIKIAFPISEGKLSEHFGHCEQFVIVTVVNNEIVKEELLSPPGHVHGAYPKFLAGQAVDVVIAGGIGQSAVSILKANGVEVITGVEVSDIQTMVSDYVNGTLESTGESCGHHDSHHHH
ncbi:MAG: hypothetical protein JXR34_10395 [Bacteroidales bacterium]|nr:hypothetical protein [Bacteroidales bacterium]